MNISGQGHSLTLVQGQSESTFLNFFSLETAGSMEAKFHLEPNFIWDEGMKGCSNGPGHMTNMAATPIYGKNIKYLLLWNQKADVDLGSWYAVSGTQVLHVPCLFK